MHIDILVLKAVQQQGVMLANLARHSGMDIDGSYIETHSALGNIVAQMAAPEVNWTPADADARFVGQPNGGLVDTRPEPDSDAVFDDDGGRTVAEPDADALKAAIGETEFKTPADVVADPDGITAEPEAAGYQDGSPKSEGVDML